MEKADKRILVVDEAWYFMKNHDSASFLYSMAKRARKYYLGVTTISQDVEDFLTNDYGKAIVSNSSIQFLMKQSSVSMPVLTDTFHLSQGEQQLLTAADVGEGVFFAGQNHVALRVVASPEEHEVITTNPEEVLRRQEQTALKETGIVEADSSSQEESASTNDVDLNELYQLINNLEEQNSNQSEDTKQNQQPKIESGQKNNLQASSVQPVQINQSSVKTPTNPYSIDSYQPPS